MWNTLYSSTDNIFFKGTTPFLKEKVQNKRSRKGSKNESAE